MSVQHLFNAIFNASLVVMLLALVASLGMTFSVKQILEPLRRVWLLVGAVVVNLGLAPLVAIGVCHLFPLTSQARVGVAVVAVGAAVVAVGAAGPVGLKSCELAKRTDLAMAVSFTIVLQLLNIVAVPLWAKAIVTGAKVNPWSILTDLLIVLHRDRGGDHPGGGRGHRVAGPRPVVRGRLQEIAAGPARRIARGRAAEPWLPVGAAVLMPHRAGF